MNKDFQKIIISVAATIIFVISLLPKNAEAAIPISLPYGGFNVFSVPCACSAGVVWYTWFWPLLPYLPVKGGPLAVGVPPATIWYLYYDPIVPTTWSIGKFVPLVQMCWQPGKTGCSVWPSLGYSYMAGSSLPSILKILSK